MKKRLYQAISLNILLVLSETALITKFIVNQEEGIGLPLC